VPVVVFGPNVKRVLFGDRNSLGQVVRLVGVSLSCRERHRDQGAGIRLDLDDAAYVPVTNAMKMFNLDVLMESDVAYVLAQVVERLMEEIRWLLTDRHRGTENFTVTTQTAMLEVLDDVMRVLTLSAAGIAGISLIVGAIGILTMMWISVGERYSEIGLLRALGARPRQIILIFLFESMILAMLGGGLGVILGVVGALLLTIILPGLPVYVDEQYLLVGLLVAIATGLFSGVAPARRAIRIDPVESLHPE
jgi:putative ABC transport system permease protein